MLMHPEGKNLFLPLPKLGIFGFFNKFCFYPSLIFKLFYILIFRTVNSQSPHIFLPFIKETALNTAKETNFTKHKLLQKVMKFLADFVIFYLRKSRLFDDLFHLQTKRLKIQ